MGILGRYLLRRFLVYFAATFFVLSLAVLMAEMLLNIDEVAEASGGFVSALRYLVLKVSSDYLFALVPVAAFIAAFGCLGVAARSLELTAIKAGGVSPLVVVIPLLGAAALLSAATFAFAETAGVEATRSWQRQYRGEDAEISYERGSFWYHRGNLVYNVRDADPESGTLEDVRVYRVDDRGRLVEAIHASTARIEDGRVWRLRDATIRRFDPGAPLSPPAFERVAESRLELSSEKDLALLDAGEPSSLTLADLREYIESQSFQGKNVARLRAHLHQRLTDPVIAFLFALLAVPLGMRVERTRTLALPAVQGIGLIAAFWVARSLGGTIAAEGAVPAALAPWTVLAAFGVVGVISLARVPR